MYSCFIFIVQVFFFVSCDVVFLAVRTIYLSAFMFFPFLQGHFPLLFNNIFGVFYCLSTYGYQLFILFASIFIIGYSTILLPQFFSGIYHRLWVQCFYLFLFLTHKFTIFCLLVHSWLHMNFIYIRLTYMRAWVSLYVISPLFNFILPFYFRGENSKVVSSFLAFLCLLSFHRYVYFIILSSYLFSSPLWWLSIFSSSFIPRIWFRKFSLFLLLHCIFLLFSSFP